MTKLILKTTLTVSKINAAVITKKSSNIKISSANTENSTRRKLYQKMCNEKVSMRGDKTIQSSSYYEK